MVVEVDILSTLAGRYLRQPNNQAGQIGIGLPGDNMGLVGRKGRVVRRFTCTVLARPSLMTPQGERRAQVVIRRRWQRRPHHCTRHPTGRGSYLPKCIQVLDSKLAGMPTRPTPRPNRPSPIAAWAKLKGGGVSNPYP